MTTKLRYVGLDVHKESIAIAVAEQGGCSHPSLTVAPICSFPIQNSATHRRTTGPLSPNLACIRQAERSDGRMTKANRKLSGPGHVSAG